MRLLVRGGNDEPPAVAVPMSSRHVVPDEKKLNGKNFSTTILAAKSSRTLERKKRTQRAQPQKKDNTPPQQCNCKGQYGKADGVNIRQCAHDMS